jgi:hypothetical protein
MKKKKKSKSKHKHISEDNPQEAKNMNINCAKQKCKRILIVIKYESIVTKGTK